MIDIQDLLDKFKLKILMHGVLKKINIILKIFFFYLAFVGIFGFSLFILEEQSQILVWACFPSQDTHRYDLLKQNCEMIKATNQTGQFINKWFMWMMPPQQLAYRAYHESMDQYVVNIMALILANEPGLFIGQQIKFKFYYKSWQRKQNNLYEIVHNKIKVLQNFEPGQKFIQVTGVPVPDPEQRGGIIIQNLAGDARGGGL